MIIPIIQIIKLQVNLFIIHLILQPCSSYLFTSNPFYSLIYSHSLFLNTIYSYSLLSLFLSLFISCSINLLYHSSLLIHTSIILYQSSLSSISIHSTYLFLASSSILLLLILHASMILIFEMLKNYSILNLTVFVYCYYYYETCQLH